MKKLITLQNLILLVLALLVVGGFLIFKQSPPNATEFQRDNASFDTSPFNQYERGVVEEVIEERIDEAPQNKLLYQHLKVNLSSGDQKGDTVETEFNQILDTAGSIKFKVGDQVVLGKVAKQPSEIVTIDTVPDYVIVDRYRVNGLLFAGLLFVVLAFVFGRRKGLLSILGLAITAVILIFFTAPQLLAGKNPVLIASVSAGIIAIVTMFTAHGFNVRTKISIASTIVSLACAIGLSYLLVYAVQLFGLGQADAFLLQTGYLGAINLQGLLLAGLIISLLGVLDDVTTAQTATVDELLKANPKLSFKELYNSAMSVGREHIASLINTLILVYVGAGLPLFLLLVAATNQPIWILLNSENIAEEIVRAIAGSAALILAVPISTLLAVYIYKRNN
jgi:uncharacterized membrane protein